MIAFGKRMDKAHEQLRSTNEAGRELLAQIWQWHADQTFDVIAVLSSNLAAQNLRKAIEDMARYGGKSVIYLTRPEVERLLAESIQAGTDKLLGQARSSGGEEPAHLRRAKRAHQVVQASWQATPGLHTVEIELALTKPDGAAGRGDIVAGVDDNYVAIIDVKSDDWAKMSERTVRRRVKKYIDQLWDYIGSSAGTGGGNDVTPAVTLTKQPADPGRVALIEQLFEEYGIVVVWEAEPPEVALPE